MGLFREFPEETGCSILNLTVVIFLFQQLQESPAEESDGKVNAAIRQVALADLIILNKCDLVSSEHKDVLLQALRAVNASSALIQTTRCSVSLDSILDLGAYSGSSQDRITAIVEEVNKQGKSSHLDKDVGTVTLELECSISRKALDLFLQRLLWEKLATDKQGNTSHVIRFKALCSVTGESEPVLVQAVYDTYDSQSVTSTQDSNTSACRLIFIGTHLDRERLHELVLQCVEDTESGIN